MRFSTCAWFLLVAACGADSPDNPLAFSVQSADVTVLPNEELTKCFYFHTTNTKPIAVNKWVADMTPGSHHMIFFVGGPEHEEGLSGDDCSFSPDKGANQPSWVFASQSSHSEQLLPDDDGEGKPLAQVIPPNSIGALQMHYFNSGSTPLTAHVNLEAHALSESVKFTPTAPYVTYNFDIKIAPHQIGATATATCDAPAGKFWQMSTHAHKQAVKTAVMDGQSMMFESTDWEHPGVALWDSTPFFTPTSGKISWTCTYNNIGDNADSTVVDGASAATNEMCMAVGYTFPASKLTICAANSEFTGGPGTCGCL